MLEPDILLVNGRRARPTETGIGIVETTGDAPETIPFDEIASARREGQAITLFAQAGGSRTLVAASILDADRLMSALPADIPISFTVTSTPPPTMTPTISRPEQRSKGTGNTIRWIAVGCLTLFSLFLLCPIAFLAYWVYDGVDSGLDDTVRANLIVGETAEVGGPMFRYRVTILDIQDNAQSSNPEEQPAEGYRYWVAQVRVENTGLLETSDSLFGSPDWYLRPSDGGTLAELPDVTGFGQTIDDSLILQPQDEVEGVLVFQVPVDEEVTSLELSMGVNDDELEFVAP